VSRHLEALAVIGYLYQCGQISKESFKFLAEMIIEHYISETVVARLTEIEQRVDNLLERVTEARV
jgi:hypothetical protein